jgi:hypothetical protein
MALTLLYLAGYVHRDVGPGNIIIIEQENGRTGGKLSTVFERVVIPRKLFDSF